MNTAGGNKLDVGASEERDQSKRPDRPAAQGARPPAQDAAAVDAQDKEAEGTTAEDIAG